MLTALEVHGFKSFADRTRFDFPAGITVVVGPNGSGKSNVVDAMKWVLGAQSAKALRGKEMADVIFKGSSAGRKPMNTAEATIVFDNSAGLLPIEAKEVRVTRRVYRSGEGEYLLNGQACRLKDVKDLFRGSGVGSDAYSLIEQGKVSGLLQASAKDRRAIFEEAAGISRFKAKKVETERRLARVEQNMLRLSDIVDEVENRLKTVRSQASKARKYREYSERLQQLRTQVGMTDWRKLSEQLAAQESQLSALREKVAEHTSQATQVEADVMALEMEAATVDAQLHSTEAKIATNREQIASAESTVEHQRGRVHDLDQELIRNRRQLAAMYHRVGELEIQVRETLAAVKIAEDENESLRQRRDDLETQAVAITGEMENLRELLQTQRQEHLALVRSSSDLTNQIGVARSEAQAAAAQSQRARQLLEQATEEYETQLQSVEQLESQQRSLETNLEQQKRQVAAAEDDLNRSRRRLGQAQKKWQELSSRRARVTERLAILQELEQRREGIHTGVQEVLARAQSLDAGPCGCVCGMLGELLEVEVESAPIIETALGDLAQAVVVSDDRLHQHFMLEKNQPTGRVALLRLKREPQQLEGTWTALERQQGVIGRADRFVRCESRFIPLVRTLLGSTWIVETLADAARLSKIAGGGLRFVALDGSILEPDGMLVIRARAGSSGVISRRSELRALHQEEALLETETAQQLKSLHTIEEQIAEAESQTRRVTDLSREMASELSQQKAAVQAAQRQLERAEKQLEIHTAEQRAAAQLLHRSETARQEAEAKLAEVEAATLACESALRQTTARHEELQIQDKAIGLKLTTSQVEAAKSDQKLDGLKIRFEQLQRDREERLRALDDAHAQLAASRHKLSAGELTILAASSELASLYLSREGLDREIAVAFAQRAVHLERRGALSSQLQKCRQQIHKAEDQLHRTELSAGDARRERDHLAARLKEDYGIDLSEMGDPLAEEDVATRESVEEEIADLRRKISNIGAVNMDALEELDAIEARFNSLAGQHKDLQDAKAALEKIIQRINTDSRRLFTETLEAVRTNFQALYRKLFGGGHADIVLEQGVDVLEAGVEIVANPPGKPAFSNSLLSGGEQGLTAVSLLLAIFQHRPSPFCVLDEVDAPLDESNIGRFVGVLREFLEWTKFVVVTHSKKTMTAANTLYGITMQEPNVSKRVSVRFEDVSENGEISQQAIARDAAETANSPDDERGAA